MPQFISAASALMTIFVCGSSSANSIGTVSSICDTAAHIAAQEFEIPVDVLLALTRTETGRGEQQNLNPWPWAVNIGGSGRWFANRAEALSFVVDHHQNGANSFDIGCFQINHKWHGKHFNSIGNMFDPILNAKYAARFLTQLFLEFGSWSAAAGAFHSRTPSKAERYTVRFNRIRLSVRSRFPDTVPAKGPPLGVLHPRQDLKMATISVRPLVTGGAPKLGSLFPKAPPSKDNISIIDTQLQGS